MDQIFTIAITPDGELRLASGDASTADFALASVSGAALRSAFAQSSASGLLLLASLDLGSHPPAPFVFWQGWTRRFFRDVCHLGEEEFEQWPALAPPDELELEEFAGAAPPMRGLEYLTPDVLRKFWTELRGLVVARASSHHGGPASYLRSVNPFWNLLGRVTFHLAENKRDPSRPFAFLATFAHRLSDQGKVRHLPLAKALIAYAGANDHAKLEALLEPVRRAAEQSKLARELVETRALFAPQAWSIRQAHRFLKEAATIEEAGVALRLPDWWSVRKPSRPQVQVKIGQTRKKSSVDANSLLDFQVGLALDGEALTAEEAKQLLQGTEELTLLRGKWVEVDRDRLKEALDHWRKLQKLHPDGISFIEGMRLLAGVSIADASEPEEHVASWTGIVPGRWLDQTLERLRHPERFVDQDKVCRPGRDLKATLRPYQADGVRWLWFMTELGLGACLADDMGLGKTIQVLDLLLQRKRTQGKEGARPSLLIVPASLIGNWKSEIARFAPSLRVFFAHRAESSAEELAKRSGDPINELAGFDLVVTTYGMARRQAWLEDAPWSLIVLDEAQAIKNASSTQTRAIKKLSAAGRIALTGTPVENHLGDLWSIFDFSCPGLLGSSQQFKQYVKRLSANRDANAYGGLRRLVRPYILRRMKTDPAIVPDLPDKTEMRTECALTKKQAALYAKAVADLKARLEDQDLDAMARRGLVLSALMQFKQICNHPSQYLNQPVFSPEESGKFERLELLCEPIIERQEKALVFTQFQSITQPLADYLTKTFDRPSLVLHGGTPARKRSELVSAFQNDPSAAFFVISLKAGGVGLNLTAASHVIHFDRWWNPAVENQATDRAFRIGQKKNVLVHKFVCRGTVEERIDAMIAAKREIADQVLGGGGEIGLTEMSNDELLTFVALDIRRAGGDD